MLSIAACSGKGSEHKLNHLANEQSPYLLQHADNPVDWYPWGEEAFAKAKAENKPIIPAPIIIIICIIMIYFIIMNFFISNYINFII